MTISYNKLSVRVHTDRICDNFRLLGKLAPSPVAIIKSDAYGHGLLPVSRALAAAGAATLAVGTVGEAVQLRNGDRNNGGSGRYGGFDGRIIALLGATDAEEARACHAERIIPFVFSLDHLRVLSQAGSAESPVAVALKFDTGMARLGFSENDLPELITALRTLPGVRLSMVASHFAASDEPDKDDFTRTQHACFTKIIRSLRESGFAFEATIANSAALLAHAETHHDLQRPGIALYGANPLHGTKREHLGAALVPAMEVSAPVLQVHDLPKGTSISYGRTFTAPRHMRVAIVAAGYADAYSRGLSNRGSMVIHDHRAPIVGRVCMQMTAVDVTDLPPVCSGDTAWLLGGGGNNPVTPEDLSAWWGTIPYEVFCLLGMNPKTFF
ncbi:alanine racemase [Desulfovibrio psychrotolerans]|uniref:Alanine racemase n=1 Tax=Desulfovibrio psychrotolerans TaxID=415242 RepID=A0A7J0BU83_9BACT|nr:alanine racemase [Desulfovibrio psychrotolerans]GFM37277.1 alanine racemase [Desulfovibrio psychrotolerans]